MHSNLRSYLAALRVEKQLSEITVEVDPYLEAAEIHRRIVAEGGPALLFRNVKGAAFPLVTNLFGTKKRIEMAFGSKPENLVRQIAALPHEMMPPSLSKLWGKRRLLLDLSSVGLKRTSSYQPQNVIVRPAKLSKLPLLTTWKEDGGAFVTLPLVYTEHPVTKVHNLGMYRMQRYDDETTGMHFQIAKGGGYHLFVAKERNECLPVNVAIGGPPAIMLAAIAPLPENVPELLLASLLLGKRVKLSDNPLGPLPIISEAEFTLVGEVNPNETHPEGPFGDHYGYYSLKHDYPVFRCKGVLHRDDAICAATVVGKPKQEDFFLGDYLQELLSPLFPVVMPAVRDLWSYGETGYHSLAAAVVNERYKREAMTSAFRILGEGQLALTKFLLVTNSTIDLKDFKGVLEHILARADLSTDLFLFSNLSMDTLDYAGPKVNEGSKGVLLGIGDPVRDLPRDFDGEIPSSLVKVRPFCRGCLVVEGESFQQRPGLGSQIANLPVFKSWPLIVLVDSVDAATASTSNFLWHSFTRFEPAADIHAKGKSIVRNHIAFESPIVLDARMKPWYPMELNCDPDTAALVDRRWKEYFPSNG